jgi:hypothetical protein
MPLRVLFPKINNCFQLYGVKNNHRIDENGRKEKRCCKGS